MALTVEKLMLTLAACVRLEAAESKISLVVPVEIDDAAHTAEFVLPELPISTEEWCMSHCPQWPRVHGGCY
ncbi:hypothetical protein GQ600_20989 [Phytophthora cactorum]|nr:hypothetical protein GQ600_20989 [Phytophthora cactorum]